MESAECSPLHLASFTQHKAFEIPLHCCMNPYFNSFDKQSFYFYHRLFTHLPVDEYLACFQFSVNKRVPRGLCSDICQTVFKAAVLFFVSLAMYGILFCFLSACFILYASFTYKRMAPIYLYFKIKKINGVKPTPTTRKIILSVTINELLCMMWCFQLLSHKLGSNREKGMWICHLADKHRLGTQQEDKRSGSQIWAVRPAALPSAGHTFSFLS